MLSNHNLPFIQQLFQRTRQVIFLYDLGLHRFYTNAAFEKMFGFSIEILNTDAGSTVQYIHPDDRQYVMDYYSLLISGETKETLEFRMQTPEKKQKWICLTAFLLDEKGRKAIGGFADDVTPIKEYNANLLKYNASKNSTLEILSHDLAAPFATIRGMASLIERKVQKYNDPVISDFLTHIKESSKRGTDLIRDFVNQEFLESSQVVVHKKRVDIGELLHDLITTYQRGEVLIPKKFEIVAPQEPVYVEIDEMKFMQVLNNLISNSIKFTQDDGTITLRVEDFEHSTIISVADNGIGIPEKMQPYLFDKFTRARRPGIKGEKSTGLGMSIIKTIVELHQGKIWFESKEDAGSTFYIEVPKEG
jgi:two-component system sensor histidine kinase VicK